MVGLGCECSDATLNQLDPIIEVTPAQLRIPPSTPGFFTITNRGSGRLRITGAAWADGGQENFNLGASDFLLGPGESEQLWVTAAVREPGVHQATVQVTSNDPQQPLLEVGVEVEIPEGPLPPPPAENPALSVCVASAQINPPRCLGDRTIDFGSVPLGQPQSAQVIVKNVGSAPLEVSTELAQSAPDLQLSPVPWQAQLSAGQAQTIEVLYTPGATSAAAILRVGSNDPAQPSVEIPIRGASVTEGCGSIEGSVCDVAGGPAVGAQVWVDAQGQRHQATTDAQGAWRMDCVPPGSWTFTAQSGSWSTTFAGEVVSSQHTTLAGEECLDPRSAQVAVIWGEWDSMQDVLTALNIPHTLYMNSADLLLNPTELAQYDIVFFNCGWNEEVMLNATTVGNIRSFVNAGGSVYASDLAYDMVELGWPSFVDFYGDDTIRDEAEWGPLFEGTVNVLNSALVTALGGQTTVFVESLGTAMESTSANTQVHLQGDRLGDGVQRPFMVSFQPSPTSGRVFFTDFHNSELSAVNTLFNWLIQQL